MGNDVDTPKRSASTPWTLRVYESLPGTALSIGIVFAIVLLLAFFLGRAAIGSEGAAPGDLRIAVTQILMTAYAATAYAYVLLTARTTTAEFVASIETLPDREEVVATAGTYARGLMPLVGAVNFLVLGVGITNATTPGSAWDWQTWSYDVVWHRVTTLLFVWWTGCFSCAVMVESARLSRLSGSIKTLDLLDMQPYQPLVRQGLTNALLVIGLVSVLSLLGVESRYWPALIGLWLGFIVLAWIGLMLPLRGIRKQFKAAKARELDWCTARLRQSRDALKTGADADPSFADVLAYQTMIEGLRNWPFDNSTLARFTLYLLIPLGSWLGGAFVERALDLILS